MAAMSSGDASYLEPYLTAARQHGAGFESLLWASPQTQAARFAALCAMEDLNGRDVLDVGCGRADFLAFLEERGIRPASYWGIEAVADLADVAERRAAAAGGRILRGDFVREPRRLFVGADVLVFSGSFNTLGDGDFYRTLRLAHDAAGRSVVFNFLSSTYLSGASYLFWRRREDVERFAGSFCRDVAFKEDYLQGDCTVRLGRRRAARRV